MDFGALNWMTITGIGVALLAIVIAVAALRNRSSKELVEKSEAATRDLYKEEDIATRMTATGAIEAASGASRAGRRQRLRRLW
jgi:hypothetical protein